MSLAPTDTDFGGAFAPRAQAAFGSVVRTLALVTAFAGGLVLVAITLMTVVSITTLSRAFVWAPDVADFFKTIEGGYYELVQAGTAFAVFAFLPWCQFVRGHVTVDIFVIALGERVMAALALVGNVLLVVISSVIVWRLWLGMLDKRQYGETTFILQFPAWWGYAAALWGAALFVVVAIYTVWRSLNEVSGFGEKAETPGGR